MDPSAKEVVAYEAIPPPIRSRDDAEFAMVGNFVKQHIVLAASEMLSRRPYSMTRLEQEAGIPHVPGTHYGWIMRSILRGKLEKNFLPEETGEIADYSHLSGLLSEGDLPRTEPSLTVMGAMRVLDEAVYSYCLYRKEPYNGKIAKVFDLTLADEKGQHSSHVTHYCIKRMVRDGILEERREGGRSVLKVVRDWSPPEYPERARGRKFASKLEAEGADIICNLGGKVLGTQFKIPGYNYRYDMLCEIDGKEFLLEVDGVQHDMYVPHFHGSEEEFRRQKERDLSKMVAAIENGYELVRAKAYVQSTYGITIEEQIREELDLPARLTPGW